MSDNPLKKLADRLNTVAPAKRHSKSNRTLSLLEPQFSVFLKYCRSKGRTASEVVDELVALYLDQVKSELPNDMQALSAPRDDADR